MKSGTAPGLNAILAGLARGIDLHEHVQRPPLGLQMPGSSAASAAREAVQCLELTAGKTCDQPGLGWSAGGRRADQRRSARSYMDSHFPNASCTLFLACQAAVRCIGQTQAGLRLGLADGKQSARWLDHAPRAGRQLQCAPADGEVATKVSTVRPRVQGHVDRDGSGFLKSWASHHPFSIWLLRLDRLNGSRLLRTTWAGEQPQRPVLCEGAATWANVMLAAAARKVINAALAHLGIRQAAARLAPLLVPSMGEAVCQRGDEGGRKAMKTAASVTPNTPTRDTAHYARRERRQSSVGRILIATRSRCRWQPSIAAMLNACQRTERSHEQRAQARNRDDGIGAGLELNRRVGTSMPGMYWPVSVIGNSGSAAQQGIERELRPGEHWGSKPPGPARTDRPAAATAKTRPNAGMPTTA